MSKRKWGSTVHAPGGLFCSTLLCFGGTSVCPISRFYYHEDDPSSTQGKWNWLIFYMCSAQLFLVVCVPYQTHIIAAGGGWLLYDGTNILSDCFRFFRSAVVIAVRNNAEEQGEHPVVVRRQCCFRCLRPPPHQSSDGGDFSARSYSDEYNVANSATRIESIDHKL